MVYGVYIPLLMLLREAEPSHVTHQAVLAHCILHSDTVVESFVTAPDDCCPALRGSGVEGGREDLLALCVSFHHVIFFDETNNNK